MKDRSLGEKRLASMPDRVTNTVRQRGRIAPARATHAAIHRPVEPEACLIDRSVGADEMSRPTSHGLLQRPACWIGAALRQQRSGACLLKGADVSL